MFQALEIGRKLDKATFKAKELELHMALLAAQRQIKQSKRPVIIVLAGVEGAGKSYVVNRFNKWLDTRGLETVAFWDESDEERQRPAFWRYWRRLPKRGEIGIMFGSWYTRLILDRVFDKIDEGSFEKQLRQVVEFERMLTRDGAIIVKLWLHISKETQTKRLKKKQNGNHNGNEQVSPFAASFAKHYDHFREVSEVAIRLTDRANASWHLIEATDTRYRDFTSGSVLLESLTQGLAHDISEVETATVKNVSLSPPEIEQSFFGQVDLSKKLERPKYQDKLSALQEQLYDVAWDAKRKGISSVAAFEGWDAAGKGGAIRRMTGAMDARLFRVISTAAPNDEEKAHHYLWRFWRQVPRAGYVTIYDRSWYGRVLVERVEGFASEAEWRRAYREINAFEELLCEAGILMMKFWIHIDKDEQLRRFEERKVTPRKQHKITEEDWRNREKWDAYQAAAEEMIARTDTNFAPWHVIPGNDKYFARVAVLEHFTKSLARVCKDIKKKK
jgi:polyphosphate:AMP phosphotransferase